MPSSLFDGWEPSDEPISGYRLVRLLGTGSFGEVWEAEAPGGLSKALKLVPLEEVDPRLSSRELKGLEKIRSIRHPFLMSTERFEIIDGFLAIVMKLADSSLDERFNECVAGGLPGIPREELLRYMRETAEVLDLMNRIHELQHLDIKPTNLLLSSGHVQVADFGLVRAQNSSVSQSGMALTPAYAAPELFSNRIERTTDQYSLAITYQELLTGTRPYDATDIRLLLYQHLKADLNLTAVPPCDRPIITRALRVDAEQRFASCMELVEALEKAESEFSLDRSLDAVPVEVVSPKAPRERTPSRPRVLVKRARDEKGARPHRRSGDSPMPIATPMPVGIEEEPLGAEEYRVAFSAVLPPTVFAPKLRGFIDALEAEVKTCSAERTVLCFGPRGWLGSARRLFLRLDVVPDTASLEQQQVDVVVWSSDKTLRGDQLTSRAIVLVRALKAFLMVVDNDTRRHNLTAAQVRARILS